MEVVDNRLVFGEKLMGVRYKLESGKSIEGLRIPDRDRPGFYALKTAFAPLLLIPIPEIKSEEAFERFESDFYSASEIYEKKMLEKPPAPNDAAAHLAMARWASGIALYGKAIEHLEQAKIIDPRTEERNQDFRAELYQRHANQQAQEIFDLMLRETRGNDFLSALDHIQQLDRSFKNSDLKRPLGRASAADRSGQPESDFQECRSDVLSRGNGSGSIEAVHEDSHRR